MSRVAFVNGAYVPFARASVHVEDRGLQFGDSVYEVFAVVGGRCIDEQPHWDRLARSLDEIGQDLPMSVAALSAHVHETIRRNKVRHGLAYIQVTRGVSRRDHAFPRADLMQTIIITARRTDPAKAEALAAKGIAVTTIPDGRWDRCDIKTTSLLANVLAKQAARDAGSYEAWLVDRDGFVTEGSSTNAWIVDGAGRLVTRSLSAAILPGVTRLAIMSLAQERGMPIVERAFTVAEAQAAREAFITSAGSFVTGVVMIDGQTVGDGVPGPITLGLRHAYRDAIVTCHN